MRRYILRSFVAPIAATYAFSAIGRRQQSRTPRSAVESIGEAVVPFHLRRYERWEVGGWTTVERVIRSARIGSK